MIELNDKNFEETVGEGAVLVDFWAPWCVPCKISLPHVEAFAAENPGIKVAKVNIDATEIADRLSIQSIPTFILFKDGVEIERHIGTASKAVLQSKFGA